MIDETPKLLSRRAALIGGASIAAGALIAAPAMPAIIRTPGLLMPLSRLFRFRKSLETNVRSPGKDWVWVELYPDRENDPGNVIRFRWKAELLPMMRVQEGHYPRSSAPGNG